jgi:hypothetical protein
MDTLPASIPPAAVPDDEKGEEPKKSLGDLRQQLETGQGLTPPTGDEAVIENKNRPLVNPRIKTLDVENTKPE